jgi:hypothetical protein
VSTIPLYGSGKASGKQAHIRRGDPSTPVNHSASRARHPESVAHPPPARAWIYSVIEQIVERSGTPFFSFKDMDENCPANSIRLRVETIDYFLKRYQQDRLL